MQSKIRIDFLHSFMMLYIKAFIKGSWYFNDAQKIAFSSQSRALQLLRDLESFARKHGQFESIVNDDI